MGSNHRSVRLFVPSAGVRGRKGIPCAIRPVQTFVDLCKGAITQKNVTVGGLRSNLDGIGCRDDVRLWGFLSG